MAHKFLPAVLLTLGFLARRTVAAAADQIVFQAVNNTAGAHSNGSDSTFYVSWDDSDMFEASRDDPTTERSKLCVSALTSFLLLNSMIISFQCSILNITLPGKVFFPDSEEYQEQEASYYALAQSELKPTCRVSATSADDVSVIVRIAGDNECNFAVRSVSFILRRAGFALNFILAQVWRSYDKRGSIQYRALGLYD
jgi:hypothetical protein